MEFKELLSLETEKASAAFERARLLGRQRAEEETPSFLDRVRKTVLATLYGPCDPRGHRFVARLFFESSQVVLATLEAVNEKVYRDTLFETTKRECESWGVEGLLVEWFGPAIRISWPAPVGHPVNHEWV